MLISAHIEGDSVRGSATSTQPSVEQGDFGSDCPAGGLNSNPSSQQKTTIQLKQPLHRRGGVRCDTVSGAGEVAWQLDDRDRPAHGICDSRGFPPADELITDWPADILEKLSSYAVV